jgi:hypothetical protein
MKRRLLFCAILKFYWLMSNLAMLACQGLKQPGSCEKKENILGSKFKGPNYPSVEQIEEYLPLREYLLSS